MKNVSSTGTLHRFSRPAPDTGLIQISPFLRSNWLHFPGMAASLCHSYEEARGWPDTWPISSIASAPSDLAHSLKGQKISFSCHFGQNVITFGSLQSLLSCTIPNRMQKPWVSFSVPHLHVYFSEPTRCFASIF